MNALSGTLVDRRSERTHLFLVATLYAGQESTAVRVRNLSATGALVEGASLPQVGTAIVLRRGALEAVGTAVWAVAGKAGLCFNRSVDVSAWLPTQEGKRQTQVDQIAFGLNQAARVVDAVVAPALDSSLSMADAVADLVAVQAQLCQLGDRLALDAALLAKHPEVQLLDVAGQRIGKIIQVFRTVKA